MKLLRPAGRAYLDVCFFLYLFAIINVIGNDYIFSSHLHPFK